MLKRYFVTKKKWRNFTRQEIECFVKESKSLASLAEKLGYNKNNGHYPSQMRDMINKLNLNVSHFTGPVWNKNKFDYSRFRKGNTIKRSAALKALIALRGHRCEHCGNTQWFDKPIPLEIHHRDGDSLNNDLNNLQLLCPNCHAFTDNYRGRNINNNNEKVSDDEFANALKNSKNIRQALLKLGLSAKGSNYTRAREIIFKYNIIHLVQEHQKGNLLSECPLNGEYSENAVLTQ